MLRLTAARQATLTFRVVVRMLRSHGCPLRLQPGFRPQLTHYTCEQKGHPSRLVWALREHHES